jgi:hypothetical protein
MQHLPEDECARFIEDLRNRETCQWCRHPRESILPRLRLCNHCNYMRLKLRKLERRNEAFEREHGGLLRDMLLDVRVQRHMIENAQAEGEIYRYFFDDDLLPLGLENEFRKLSAHFGKDVFNGMANSLNHSFSLNQRRFLFYLLSLMNREAMRKSRRNRGQMAALEDPPDGRVVIGELRR